MGRALDNIGWQDVCTLQEEKTQTQIAGGLQAVPKKPNLNVNRRLCVP